MNAGAEPGSVFKEALTGLCSSIRTRREEQNPPNPGPPRAAQDHANKQHLRLGVNASGPLT